MKILYIENHKVFASLITKKLLFDYSIVIVPSLAAAKLEIETKVFDLILLDYDLDDGKGK